MRSITTCCKKTAWMGLAVISIVATAGAFMNNDAKEGLGSGEAVVQEETSVQELIQEETLIAEVETQTEDIVENEIAEIETDEIYQVMGTIDKESQTEESTQEQVTEAVTQPQAVIHYSQEDYENFLRIVEAEATGADVLSKMMVANVIINRVRSPYFPNTITEVVFQGGGEQFSPIYDGRFYTVAVTDSTVEAVNRALLGEDYSQGATYFAAVYVVTPECWHARNLKRLFEYGGHIFFKEF